MSASALLSPAAHSSVLDLPNSQSYAMEPIVKSLLTSTWHVLDQPPPPSLREILGAYKAKGDGDREMLISMLNAKSAEDQRIASMASLHRTMLEMYSTPLPATASQVHDNHPTHMYQPHFPTPPPTTSYHNSPPLPAHAYPNAHNHAESSVRLHKQPAAAPEVRSRERERERDPPASAGPSRKRRRTSRSPVAHSREPRPRAIIPNTRPTLPHDMPPSPYSSSSTHGSTHDSPRSRESMAIGSLLSEPDSGLHHTSTSRRTSSERSTTSTSPAPTRR